MNPNRRAHLERRLAELERRLAFAHHAVVDGDLSWRGVEALRWERDRLLEVVEERRENGGST